MYLQMLDSLNRVHRGIVMGIGRGFSRLCGYWLLHAERMQYADKSNYVK